jgi:hypothetical protein
MRETREVHHGRNSRTGDDFTLYQIVATKPDGTLIEENLRSFEDLPRDEVLPVEVTPFVSDQYGMSYTLKLRAKSKQGQKLDELEERIARIESHLGLESNSSSQQPGPPPPPQPSSQPPPPPPPISQQGGSGRAF